MSKIEPEEWNHGLDWQLPEGTGEVGTDWEEVKGLVKEHVLTIEVGGDWVERGKRGKKWDNYNSINNKNIKKNYLHDLLRWNKVTWILSFIPQFGEFGETFLFIIIIFWSSMFLFKMNCFWEFKWVDIQIFKF